MKLLDTIEIINDNYANLGIPKGTKGIIVLAEIRGNAFDCELLGLPKNIYPEFAINIADMKVLEESDYTDEELLEELPTPDPHWWCKVEDGYIVNLLGERKNKIPYDYDS